jgi:hypothetical protein
MRVLSDTGASSAINLPVRAESGKSIAVQTDSDNNGWFSNPARVLLGSDPGLALHVLTGISESSGYRYASGERAVPGWVIRGLLHGPQGWQWLNAVMDGSTAVWWTELVERKRCADAYEAARK